MVALSVNHPNAKIRQVIDHPLHVTEIGKIANQKNIGIGALIEVESGQQRCGVNPDSSIVALIELIYQTEGVRYDVIRLIPSHWDTSLHNFDVLYGVRDGEVVHQWKIQGRGRSD